MTVSVAEKVGVVPEIGLLLASKIVMVIVEVELPSATIELVPVIVDVATAGESATKVTAPSALVIGEAMERVLTSALVEVMVQVETPEPLVEEQAL